MCLLCCELSAYVSYARHKKVISKTVSIQ